MEAPAHESRITEGDKHKVTRRLLHLKTTMIDCEICDRTFVDWHAAKQHMNVVGHWECETCTGEFWTQEAADDHMQRHNHFRPRFECEACDNEYDTLGEAMRHMHQKEAFV